MANLCDYNTGDTVRTATAAEQRASIEAAAQDGGAGVILVDGRRCYVETEAGDIETLSAILDDSEGDAHRAAYDRYDTAVRLAARG